MVDNLARRFVSVSPLSTCLRSHSVAMRHSNGGGSHSVETQRQDSGDLVDFLRAGPQEDSTANAPDNAGYKSASSYLFIQMTPLLAITRPMSDLPIHHMQSLLVRQRRHISALLRPAS